MKSAIFLIVASLLLCSALRLESDADVFAPIEGTEFKFHKLEEDVHITSDKVMSVPDNSMAKENVGEKIAGCKFGKADFNPLRSDDQYIFANKY